MKTHIQCHYKEFTYILIVRMRQRKTNDFFFLFILLCYKCSYEVIVVGVCIIARAVIIMIQFSFVFVQTTVFITARNLISQTCRNQKTKLVLFLLRILFREKFLHSNVRPNICRNMNIQHINKMAFAIFVFCSIRVRSLWQYPIYTIHMYIYI